MAHAVEVRPQARRQLRRLPRATVERVREVIQRLVETPRPIHCIKLQGRPGVLRVRVGDYRVLYQVDDCAEVVTILAVRHRRDVYSR